MKGIGIVFALILFSGFVVSQEAFAFSEPPTKEEKKVMSGVFLAGFVVIYAGVIYHRKATENNSIRLD